MWLTLIPLCVVSEELPTCDLEASMAAPILIAPSANAPKLAVVQDTAHGSQLYLYILMLCSSLGGFLFGYDTVRSLPLVRYRL